MLKLVHVGGSLPTSFIVDPSAEFQPGMIGQLVVLGNQIMVTVSNGTAPLGIIDDIKTRAFTNVSWNEEVKIAAVGVPGPNGQLVTPVDVKVELRKSNIIASSFSSTVKVALNANNGVITFLAGTPLNADLMGTGEPNGFRTIVNYTYYVPNIPGDDSTQGSGRVTIWYQRMFFQTTMYESNQQYPVNANLFCSEHGVLTTRQPSKIHPAIGIVTAPPSPMSPMLEVLFL